MVKVVGSMRDHRSRTTADALRFLKLEGFLRGLAGTRFLAGNHIVLDLGDGAYAFLAHLKRGSARVRRGQEVEEVDLLALCGNSGNSSEPHLHFQLIEHPLPIVAAGVPFSFDVLLRPLGQYVSQLDHLPVVLSTNQGSASFFAGLPSDRIPRHEAARIYEHVFDESVGFRCK